MFIYNLKAMADKLRIDCDDVISRINHNGEKGTAREEILKKYLADFLPLKFSIGNGIVVDSNEKQSKQQDFVIYDGFNSPLMLKMQTMQVIPIESVYSCIEVKSNLSKKELLKCADNIKSVLELQKCCLINTPLTTVNTNKTIGVVFAYTSSLKLDTIYKNLYEINQSIPPEHQISIICILDKGLIFNVAKLGLNKLELYPNGESVLACSDNDLDNNLYSFYLMLLQHLNLTNLLPPDLIKYAEKANAFKIQPHMEVELLPDDSILEISGGPQLLGDDIKKISSTQPIFSKFLSGGKLSAEESKDMVETLNILVKSLQIPKP